MPVMNVCCEAGLAGKALEPRPSEPNPAAGKDPSVTEPGQRAVYPVAGLRMFLIKNLLSPGQGCLSSLPWGSVPSSEPGSPGQLNGLFECICPEKWPGKIPRRKVHSPAKGAALAFTPKLDLDTGTETWC